MLVAALVDSGPDGIWAESVIARGSLAAPESALAEASNILRRLEQATNITLTEATVAHNDLLRLDFELFPFTPFANRVWDLRDNLNSYDSWYVALAEALTCPLGHPRPPPDPRPWPHLSIPRTDRHLSHGIGPGVKQLRRLVRISYPNANHWFISTHIEDVTPDQEAERLAALGEG